MTNFTNDNIAYTSTCIPNESAKNDLSHANNAFIKAIKMKTIHTVISPENIHWIRKDNGGSWSAVNIKICVTSLAPQRNTINVGVCLLELYNLEMIWILVCLCVKIFKLLDKSKHAEICTYRYVYLTCLRRETW